MKKEFCIEDGCYQVKCRLFFGDEDSVDHVVLCCHGFAGTKESRASTLLAERILSKCPGTVVVTFDWPCHGKDAQRELKSDVCCTYMGLMVKYLLEKYPGRALYLYATSFGAYLTLRYIHENGNPFRKIVLRSPAVNMYDVLTKNIISPDDLAVLQKGQDVLAGFARKVQISNRFCDELRAFDATQIDYSMFADAILVIHGISDEIVPIDAVFSFVKKNSTSFIPVEGADHRFIDPGQMEVVIKETLAFFGLSCASEVKGTR